jgi:hypothetical protein
MEGYFMSCGNNSVLVQTHVHEFLGSTKLAEEEEERHNHRFAGVSGEAKRISGTTRHRHAIMTNTDFFDHFHQIRVESGPNIDVGDGRHVHFADSRTSEQDGHRHDLIFATLIDNPIGD